METTLFVTNGQVVFSKIGVEVFSGTLKTGENPL
jgi:hypothetical protein